MITLLDLFVRQVPIYHLQCNISEDAVKLVYHTTWRDINED